MTDSYSPILPLLLAIFLNVQAIEDYGSAPPSTSYLHSDLHDVSRTPQQEESRLLTHLMKNYDKEVRPVFNASKAVIIYVGITLTQIFDMDEKNQVMTTNVWLDQEWHDELLTWNPADFNGISRLRIPCDRIWLPDIVLYNNADDFTTTYMRSQALVTSDGQVFWPPPTKFRSTCAVDVAFFPFDDQVCMLKLASWIHDGFSVNLTNRSALVDLTNYVPNGEWTLLDPPQIIRSVRYFPCCKEPFPQITITLRIRRKTLYYMYNIVFPCMMMSTLTVLVFCLPPDSGEKIALGVTVLLAFSVFMLAIAEKMPETSESIPLIGVYLTSVMAITSVSVIMTVIVLNFFYRGPNITHVPLWAQRYILGKKITNTGRYTCNREESVRIRRRRASMVVAEDNWSQLEKYSLNILNSMAEENSFNFLKQKIHKKREQNNGSLPQSMRSKASTAPGNNGTACPPSADADPHPDEPADANSISSTDSIPMMDAAVPTVDIRVIPPDSDVDSTMDDTQSIGMLGDNLPEHMRQHDHHNKSKAEVDLNRIIGLMTKKQKEDDQINEILKDWKMLAQKVDSFLFWVFLFITSFSSLLFLIVLPYNNRGEFF